MADPRRIREMLGFGYGSPSPAMDALTPFHAGVDPQYMPQDKVTASIEGGPSPYVRRGIESLVGLFAPSDRAAAETADKLNAVADFNPFQGAYDIGKAAGDAVQGGDKVSLAMSMIPGKVADELVPAVKAAQKGIRAYHGTPHDFEKFDISKIGTGEGAQAYGHGLYFAENEGIARNYRDNLTRPVDPDNFPLSDNSGRIPSWIANQIRQHPSGSEYHKEAARRSAELFDGRVKEAEQELLTSHQPWNVEGKIANLKELAANLRRVERGEVDINEPFAPKGHMYEVNINADPDAFLDWDAPVHDQSEAVRQSLEKLGITPPAEVGDVGLRGIINRAVRLNGGDTDPHSISLLINNDQNLFKAAERHARMNGIDVDNDMDWATPGDYVTEKANDYLRGRSVTGEDVHRRLGDRPEVAAKFREAGIPGIKYLDAGSRSGGEGSRNWVVFDDKIISVVKKNGVAAAIAAGLITESEAEELYAQGYT